MFYKTQNSYAPTAQTLVSDVKYIIEQQFPILDQDIINDAINHSVNEYNKDIVPNITVSDQEAEAFFFNSVMERILEHKRREYDALIAFMLARERHPRTPLRSDIAQDLTSGFISLPSRPIEMIAEKIAEIAEENRNKLTPKRLRFPPSNDTTQRREKIPTFIRGNRIHQFQSLNNTLRKQLIKIDYFINYWGRPDLTIQMFDEIYRLAQQNLNAIVLEREIILSINKILENSDIPHRDKIGFMHILGSTINNERNREILYSTL